MQAIRSWLLRLQSDFVLPTARTVYLIGACGAFLGVAIGLAAALYFQAGTWRSEPTYQQPELRPVGPAEVDLQTVQARLDPPRQINLKLTMTIVEGQLGGGELIGYFDAVTANGLPGYPGDFDILGGADAQLFERIPVRIDGALRSGLAVRTEGADEVNRRVAGTQNPQDSVAQGRTFSIRLIARDRYGLRSQPADIAFTLVPGEAPSTSTAQSPLQVLAGEVARAVDPSTGGLFVDVYKTVQRMPSECNASADEDSFVMSFRTAFKTVKGRVTAQTVTPFLVGVCEGWRKGKQDREQALAREEAKIIDAQREHNEAVAEVAGKKLAARIMRNLTLTFVGGALAVFLSVALLLAFLAMEGHSKALRQAVEEMAATRRREASDREA